MSEAFPLVLSSARRHQDRDEFADEDIWNAWANQVGTVQGTNGMRLVLGPARDGRWLEIGMQACTGWPPPIVHAMLARDHYVRKLQR